MTLGTGRSHRRGGGKSRRGEHSAMLDVVVHMAQAGHIDEFVAPEGSPQLREDGVDPELEALPRPSGLRRFVTMGTMVVTIAACLMLMWSFRLDARYAFATSTPTDLGEVSQIDVASAPVEEYVGLSGTPMLSQAIRYDREFGTQRYALFALAGTEGITPIFVEVPEDPAQAAMTGSRRAFDGRLTTFRALGPRYESLRDSLDRQSSQHVRRDSLLLLADRTPRDAYASVLLVLLFGIFALVNLVMLVRWFRPIRG